jgi:predicted small integral membrane protein
VIIHNRVLLQIDVVLFDYIMFSKACIRGRKRNASAWSMVLTVSLQAYLFCFLVIHSVFRSCGIDWFGRFCVDKKWAGLQL